MAVYFAWWNAVRSRARSLLRRPRVTLVIVLWMKPPKVRSLAMPRRRIAPAIAAVHGQLSLF
jgi:hypothetical protein